MPVPTRRELPKVLGRAGGCLPPVVALVLLWLALWWRGPQPDLEPPPARHDELAGQLLAQVRSYLEGESAGGALAPEEGAWYVTAYARGGAPTATVRARGVVHEFAEPLRGAMPGWLQVDRELDDPPSPRAGPWGFGLDVGLDGWVENGGAVHVPVRFLLSGMDRRELARFMGERPGRGLRTHSWVAGPAGPQWMLRHSVDPGPLGPELLRRRIQLGASYLARHLRRDGAFDYAWNAREGAPESGYNLLRHAGTTYSLFQSYQRTDDESHYRAGVRALHYLRARRRHDSQDRRRCFEVEGDKVKLGGAGLTLLALVEQAKARPMDADREWMRCLAEHIVAQTAPSGDMASFHTDGGRYRWSEHRSAYYPGEAVLGLLALHGIDPDPRWLDCARRAADFLVHERWQALGIRVRVPLDAWLLQALHRLTLHVPDPVYVEYGLAIGRAIARHQIPAGGAPDLVGGPARRGWPDAVAAGSRGEAFAAAARLERRFRPGQVTFRGELEQYARFALRNQYTEPILFGLRRPEAALGGIRSSPADPVIRIDGVQHNLSALIGLLDLMEEAP